MSTCTFGNIMKINLFIVFLLFIGCSENINGQTQNTQENITKSDKLGKEYDHAVKQAENNNPAGFLKLYEIASESRSAEISELARDKLLHFLYSKTELWISVFSKTDLEKFKNYLKAGGIAILELPEGISSEEQYDEEIIKKLVKIKGNKKETELINYMLSLYKG